MSENTRSAAYERLRAERDQLREEMRNLGKDWVERWAYENVMAQRDRYRAALEHICDLDDGAERAAPEMARAALDPTEAPQEEER